MFEKDFEWGVSTSAYQIEGAWKKDGKGISIWDEFSHQINHIKNDENGDIACNHYELYPEDFKIMKDLGIKNYRMSLSWTRIMPDGVNINQKGIIFYKKLFEEMKKNGIKPFVTLYHWDLPYELQKIGGWENPNISDIFENYAKICFENFSEYVDKWITINEPWVIVNGGYVGGDMPPAVKDRKRSLIVSHNLNLSHAKAYKIYKKMNYKGKIGITLNLVSIYPYSKDKKDLESAEIYDEFFNKWYIYPIFKGYYPKKISQIYKEKLNLNSFPEDELNYIKNTSDFLGINYYMRTIIKYSSENKLFNTEPVEIGGEYTEMKWEVYPEGLYKLLKDLSKEFPKMPLYITENGAAYQDEIENGEIHDIRRLNYIKEHIDVIKKAKENNINLKGYYLWSFLDNFEWSAGYSKRFGIVYIDYKTQKRIVKDSGKFYSSIIKK